MSDSDPLANASTVLAEQPGGEPADPGAEVHRGDHLGRFIVLAELGRGAMGVVVKAHDPKLDRTVAIKILRPDVFGGDSTEVASARLVREAKAMARVSHRNVVTVHEVDVTGDRVLIVMEHIQARNLRAWLNEEPRSRAQILEVFLQAGRGLAEVHRAGLVHRDFKPDNVLVGVDGRVCVTDFGLVGLGREPASRGAGESESLVLTGRADPIGPEALAETEPHAQLAVTRTGSLLGTPAYMAPEQHERKRADARADQFAFCAALYEALHGERPFEGETYDELRGNVLAGKLRPPPARAAVPAWLRRVLVRGLQVSPDARYPSMTPLLADLEKDPTAGRRNAVLGVAALCLGAALIAGALRGARGPDLCQGGADRLAGVWDAPTRARVEQAFAATRKPYSSDTYRRVEATLDERAAAWLSMYQDSCQATHVRGEQSAALLDLRTSCLDRRRAEMKALTSLLARQPDGDVLDKAVAAAASLPKLDVCADTRALTMAFPFPADPAARAALDALSARVDEANALRTTGQYTEGLRVATEAAAGARRSEYPPLEARALLVLGRLQGDTADLAKAEITLRDAASAAGKAGDDRLLASTWIAVMDLVGGKLARHAEALALESAASIAVERAGAEPELRAELLGVLAEVLRGKGDYAAALEKSNQAVALLEKATGPQGPALAALLGGKAKLLATLEKYKDAQAVYERALALREATLGPDHPDTAATLSDLGDLYYTLEKNEEALTCLRRSLAIREKALGPEHPMVAVSLNNIANVLNVLDRSEEARAHHLRALAIREKALGPEHPETGKSLFNIGVTYDAQRRWREAQTYYERALAVREKALGPEHRDVARVLSYLASTLDEQGKFAEARPLHERALSINEKVFGPDSLAVRDVLVLLGTGMHRSGDAARAVPLLERALTLTEKANDTSTDLARSRYCLGIALWDTGKDRKRATTLVQQARSSYAAAGEGSTFEQQEAERWLKEHGLPLK